jgi:hypothetical protein
VLRKSIPKVVLYFEADHFRDGEAGAMMVEKELSGGACARTKPEFGKPHVGVEDRDHPSNLSGR